MSADFFSLDKAELPKANRHRCQVLREIYADPKWKTFCGELLLRRAKLLERLSNESDPVVMYRMQGALRELYIVDHMPEENEALDKFLVKGEELAAMKRDLQ